jgi:hypothetical protein
MAACAPKVSSKPVQIIYFYGGMAERVHVAWVTPYFFEQHPEIRPLLGRLFKSDEYKTDPTVVMLSAAAFAQRFHSDPAATIGQSVDLAGANFMVVGVLPPDFATPDQAEFLLPKDTLP